MLSVALPKGRIAEDTLEIFEKIFGSEFRFDDRKLILQTEKFKFFLTARFLESRSRNDSNTSHFYTNSF